MNFYIGWTAHSILFTTTLTVAMVNKFIEQTSSLIDFLGFPLNALTYISFSDFPVTSLIYTVYWKLFMFLVKLVDHSQITFYKSISSRVKSYFGIDFIFLSHNSVITNANVEFN